MRPALLLAVLAAVPIALVGCGGSKSSSSSGPTVPADLTVTAPGGLKFDSTQYTLGKTGKVTIALDNKDQQSHSLVIKDANGNKVDSFRLLVAGEHEKQASVDLPAGTYQVYCDVPGHAAAGMKATLTVG
jgi:plastocyanin